MKYTLALFCLILTILLNTLPIQASPFENFSISSYEMAEAVPVKKGVKKSKKRTLKLKKKKFSKKSKLKPKASNKKKRLIYTLLIIGGCILAILSIILLFALAPTVGVITTGIVMAIATYFGWIGFAVCSIGALLLIWIGVILLNNTSKENEPLTPREQLAEDMAEKYPNIPEQKIEEYIDLEQEINELEKGREAFEGESTEESKENLRILESKLEVKEQKQVFLQELNEELEAVANRNRARYIFLKDEIYILNHKKELLERSNGDKTKIRKVNAEIEENLKNREALKK